MTSYLVLWLHRAEAFAERVIKAKDTFLEIFADLVIPIPENRKRFRTWVKLHLTIISQPFAAKFDAWVDADIITVANLISLSRALLGPIFLMFVIYQASVWVLLTLLAIVAFSDYFDGVIARRMKQQSELGGGIDAGCDKIFAVFAAAGYMTDFWLVPLILFLLFDGLLAALALSLLRAKRKQQYGGQAEVKANWLGKTKFNLQAATLLCFIFSFLVAGNYFLIAADVFAFGSLIRHLEPKKTH